MENKELILKAMNELGKPVTASDVQKVTGLDRKIVDKVFAELKKENKITSPIRCKWEPTK